jgi:hypothetical protein
MSDELSPAEHAGEIEAARDRFLALVRQCSGQDWRAAPVDGDPRPVGVIFDHVAHSYEYLAGWVGDLVAETPVDVNPDIVDALNAEHAAGIESVTPDHVTEHLRSSGDVLISLIAGLAPAQLDADGGRVRRFAQIAARHADNHRSEIESALQTAAS